LYFRSEAELELLRGTCEFHRSSEYRRQERLAAQLSAVDPESFSLNGTKFILADHFVTTHAFTDLEGCRRLMPLAINLNHDVEACVSAAWEFQRQPDQMRVWACRGVAAGEELTISYGVRSNAQLMAIYGFTLDPKLEPIFTFRAATVADVIPGTEDMNFEVQLTTLPVLGDASEELQFALKHCGGLQRFLERARTAGLPPSQALGHLIASRCEQQSRDPILVDFLQLLRRNRARRPKSRVWWMAEDDVESDGSSAERLGTWRSNVVRLKMSEHLCLVVFGEALALRNGTGRPEDSLPEAVALLPLLEELL